MIRFFCIIVQPSIQLSILELDKAEMLIKVAVNGLSEKCISYASIFCLLQLKACVYHLVQLSQIHTGAKNNSCEFEDGLKVKYDLMEFFTSLFQSFEKLFFVNYLTYKKYFYNRIRSQQLITSKMSLQKKV